MIRPRITRHGRAIIKNSAGDARARRNEVGRVNIREVGRGVLCVLALYRAFWNIPEGEDLVAHRSRSAPNFEVLVAHVHFRMGKFVQSLHQHSPILLQCHITILVHSSSILSPLSYY